MSTSEKPEETASPAEEPDDVRARFREALARKQAKEQGVPHRPDQSGPGGGHPQSAKTHRLFRRKSG